MQRFARILVVLEAHEPAGAARQELLEFARVNAAEVTVAAVGEVPEPSLLSAFFDGRDHKGALEAEARKSLASFTAPLEEAGLEVDTEIVDDDPLDGICRLARSGRFDLVAKFAEGNAPGTPFTFGPLDRGLLRLCPLPVLIANPHKEEAPRVLVALDVHNRAHDGMNAELLRIAVGQADLMKAELHIVHAWRLVGETAFRSGAFTEVSSRKLEHLKHVERGKRHRAIQDLLGPYHERSYGVVEHIVEGSPPKAIAAVARDTDSDLVIMGATGRSRFASMMLGDCAVAVLGAVDCSVLLLKTPDLAAKLETAS